MMTPAIDFQRLKKKLRPVQTCPFVPGKSFLVCTTCYGNALTCGSSEHPPNCSAVSGCPKAGLVCAWTPEPGSDQANGFDQSD